MGNLNSVTMSGRLTRDPDWRDFANGGVTGFSLAVNSSKKQGDEWVDVAHFFEWKFFDKLGRWIYDNLRKGDLAVVTGRAELDKWEDKQTGEPRQIVRFRGFEIEFGTAGKKADRVERPRETVAAGVQSDLPWESKDDDDDGVIKF